MLMTLRHLPVEFLVEEKISLLQRIAKMKEPIIHPPVGYRFNHALYRYLHERLDELNYELALRRSAEAQAADINRAFK